MKTTRLKFTNQQGLELSARLEKPVDTHPKAYVLFAHCFTCNKNLTAIRNISRSLTSAGFAVLRFDFTGLGESEGDFEDTNFSSNVSDLVDAANFLKENYEAVELMSDGEALKEFQELWSGTNPDNPSRKLGAKASIDIKIKSVSFINDKTASVRFMREVKENDRIKTGHFNAVIQFQYSQKPMQMKDRFSNPLGFQVTHYRINPEVLERVR